MQSWHGFEVVFKEPMAFAFIKLPSQITFFQTPEKKNLEKSLSLYSTGTYASQQSYCEQVVKLFSVGIYKIYFNLYKDAFLKTWSILR